MFVLLLHIMMRLEKQMIKKKTKRIEIKVKMTKEVGSELKGRA